MHKSSLAFIGIALALMTAGLLASGDQRSSDEPRYTSSGRMLRPDNYREWVYLSSGLGMSYSPQATMSGNPPFDNVFVTPAAYRAYMQTGTWPDKTAFVLEVRASQTRGSINKRGQFQGAVLGLDVHVKDERRFKGKWAFFNFEASSESASMIPTSEDCYSCHEQHGAVDTTFVQFYPTLLGVAKEKGTLKQY
jgi:Cytochrome P460